MRVNDVPYVEIDGVKIYYEVYGEGGSVALLNGIFMSTDSWIFQTRALSKKYRVILHDFRGQWRSDKPKEGYSLDQHAKDLKRLLEHLAVNKVNLVGTSYGGAVAITFALSYPEMVKSLILITVPSQSPNLRVLANRWLSACQTRDPEKFVDAWIRDVYSKEFLSKYQKILWDRLMEAFRSFDFEAGAILLKYASRFLEGESPLEPRLEAIKVPALIIAAEEDALNSVELAQMMHRKVASSEVHIIAGAGHGVVIEKPEEINTLILGFLERLR